MSVVAPHSVMILPVAISFVAVMPIAPIGVPSIAVVIRALTALVVAIAIAGTRHGHRHGQQGHAEQTGEEADPSN